MSLHTESIEFEGALGEPLTGEIERPASGGRAFAVFAHCFTGSKDAFPSMHMARRLAERGIGVLRFDFTGLGGSGGEFAETTFTTNVGDVVAAAEYLDEHFDAPALLVGHSFGGTAAIAAARRLSSVRAVATIGAPFDPAHVTHLFDEKLEAIEETGEATVSIHGRNFRIRRTFLEDVRESEMRPHLAELDRPLLVFHSPTDEVVGLENARKIYDAARHPKSFMSLVGADHLLTNRSEIDFAASILEEWAEHHLAIADVDETAQF